MGFFRKAVDFIKTVGSKAIDAGRWLGSKGGDFLTRLAPILPGPLGAAAMTGAQALRGIGAIANGIHGLGNHFSGVASNTGAALSAVKQAYGAAPQQASKIER